MTGVVVVSHALAGSGMSPLRAYSGVELGPDAAIGFVLGLMVGGVLVAIRNALGKQRAGRILPWIALVFIAPAGVLQVIGVVGIEPLGSYAFGIALPIWIALAVRH